MKAKKNITKWTKSTHSYGFLNQNYSRSSRSKLTKAENSMTEVTMLGFPIILNVK